MRAIGMRFFSAGYIFFSVGHDILLRKNLFLSFTTFQYYHLLIREGLPQKSNPKNLDLSLFFLMFL